MESVSVHIIVLIEICVLTFYSGNQYCVDYNYLYLEFTFFELNCFTFPRILVHFRSVKFCSASLGFYIKLLQSDNNIYVVDHENLINYILSIMVKHHTFNSIQLLRILQGCRALFEPQS